MAYIQVNEADLDRAYLKSVFNYDPETGLFTWRHSGVRQRDCAGRLAGVSLKIGYISIRWREAKRSYSFYAHRLAWFYETGRWPADIIDHKNGNRSDNRFCNLREASRRQNQQNRGMHPRNTSGYKNVGWNRALGKWRVRLRVNDKSIHIGLYDDISSAHRAACSAREKYFGEFARTA